MYATPSHQNPSRKRDDEFPNQIIRGASAQNTQTWWLHLNAPAQSPISYDQLSWSNQTHRIMNYRAGFSYIQCKTRTNTHYFNNHMYVWFLSCVTQITKTNKQKHAPRCWYICMHELDSCITLFALISFHARLDEYIFTRIHIHGEGTWCLE